MGAQAHDQLSVFLREQCSKKFICDGCGTEASKPCGFDLSDPSGVRWKYHSTTKCGDYFHEESAEFERIPAHPKCPEPPPAEPGRRTIVELLYDLVPEFLGNGIVNLLAAVTTDANSSMYLGAVLLGALHLFGR